MALSAISAAFADLCLAVTALVIYPFLEPEWIESSGTSTPTIRASSTHDEAIRVAVLLAATVALFGPIAFMYLHHAAAAAAFGGNKNRITERVTFALCGAVGILQFLFFVLPEDAGLDVVVDALGRAAVDALPAAAAVVFFLGITHLLLIAHIRAGGEGGGGPVVAHDRVPLPVRVQEKIALAAAAALLCQIAVAMLYAAK